MLMYLSVEFATTSADFVYFCNVLLIIVCFTYLVYELL